MGTVRQENINTGVAAARAAGSVLVDVRTEEEFACGHIPGSINVSSTYIQRLGEQFPDPDTPLYLYCASGFRSSRAALLLTSVGYTNVTDLGGIDAWSGPLDK